MLLVANQNAGSIDTYAKNHFATLQADYLSPKDWKQLHIIKSFLQPFYRATLETQGNRATIDCVLFTMDILIQYFENYLLNFIADKEFSLRIQKGWDTFDKYYSKIDESPLYAAARILHLNRRTKYICANWKTKWQKPMLKKVRDLWISH
ncbi:hypothetical protein TSTA_117840 [Talaromyces stipitatus ATCC 10500]|uniref:Uncharacterized protein n=1 Tax=Talaromyces stipitatus (strain ATCC 10500 / CBS 375.48 / QM 6759 / NRRL 1006) TaxID=441959 RepID=B8M9L0_TALSN|nr:uncharacterized protein TSTA_117840 [Talaromyces stipitatus ATCC 10500]EED18012.1 hypothetical protein TSTA_117840 [Talaromyces stipitatus ATCC 10500]